MMGEFLTKISSLLHEIIRLRDFVIIDRNLAHITAGRLVLAILVWFAGSRLLNYSFNKFYRFVTRKYLKDENFSNWVSRFLKLISRFALFICVVMILGISPSIIGSIWNLTIFSIQDHAITIGNILSGLVLIYPGIRFSRYLSTRFRVSLLEPLQLETATKFTLETIFKYSLTVIIFLFIMSIVGIPLGAFTLLGGALAIGIGFGSQNLVNNFLSGLILMIEKPLSVDDIVEVENQRGIVESIGARSTIIRTFNNVRQVIPNSKLLENTFINWSLNDPYIRREVIVGVAYGSPTEKVRDLLMQAATEHPDVEKTPEPNVLFIDFGDNALIFKLYFWLKIGKMPQMIVVDSDIRFKTEKLFRDEGIEIAFPQRDVHLDVSRPLEVNIRKSDKEQEE